MMLIHRNKKKRSITFTVVAALVIFCSVGLFLFFKFNDRRNHQQVPLLYSKQLAPPVCYTRGGFYKEPFPVELIANKNLKIFYSLDGSEPDLSSPQYTEPITIIDRRDERNNLSAIPTSPRWVPPVGNVYKGTVLRAIAVDPLNHKSSEFIRTFFIDGQQRDQLPVVSLVVNAKDFFGYNKGIYVLGKAYGDKDNYLRKNIPLTLPWWDYPANYHSRGIDAERKVHIEFFEPGSSNGFEANAGVRINGNATRGFPQKSLRICFREKYDQSFLHFRLFPHDTTEIFQSFILRNGGNDWSKTLIRDALIQTLFKNSGLDIQHYRPCIVFINGEYWGLHDIRERFDEHFLANKYRLSTDSLVILELEGKLIYGKKEEQESFQELLNFVRNHSTANDENYEYIRSKVDLENFSDFIIANVYFCNSDWPNNNVKFWRYTGNVSTKKKQMDGRWRWLLNDTDWGLGYNAQSSVTADLLPKATQVGSVGVLFNALIRNKEFVNLFLNRFRYHLVHTVDPLAVSTKIEQMKQQLSPYMIEHINRWRGISSYGAWLSNIEELKQFAKDRPLHQVDQLNRFFKLTGAQQILVKKKQVLH
jgi:hypothetical protein